MKALVLQRICSFVLLILVSVIFFWAASGSAGSFIQAASFGALVTALVACAFRPETAPQPDEESDEIWEWDIKNGTFYMYPMGRFDSAEDFLAHVHPDYGDTLRGQLELLRDENGINLSFPMADGTWIWMHGAVSAVSKGVPQVASGLANRIGNVPVSTARPYAPPEVQTCDQLVLRQKHLFRLFATLSSFRKIEEQVPAMASQVRYIVPYDELKIMLPDAAGSGPYSYSSGGTSNPSDPRTDSLCAYVMQKKAVLRYGDITKADTPEEDIALISRTGWADIKTRSILAVPIISPCSPQVWGCICVCSNDTAAFSEEDEQLLGMISVYISMSLEERKNLAQIATLMEEKEREASVDPLTGLWNRRFMFQKIKEEEDRINRYGGSICFTLVDMGNFKHVNDNFGHTKGDEVLHYVADAIKSNIRGSDFACRYGGDEFLVLLSNADETQADIMFRRLNEKLAQNPVCGSDSAGNTRTITMVLDYGSCIYPSGEAQSTDQAVSVADEKMYIAKRTRKNL